MKNKMIIINGLIRILPMTTTASIAIASEDDIRQEIKIQNTELFCEEQSEEV